MANILASVLFAGLPSAASRLFISSLLLNSIARNNTNHLMEFHLTKLINFLPFQTHNVRLFLLLPGSNGTEVLVFLLSFFFFLFLFHGLPLASESLVKVVTLKPARNLVFVMLTNSSI